MGSPTESELRPLVEQAFENRGKLEDAEYRSAVEQTIELLDKGKLRVATRAADGEWTVHAWTKQAILLYFGIRAMERVEVGAYEYHDKIPLKKRLDEQGVRVVPPGGPGSCGRPGRRPRNRRAARRSDEGLAVVDAAGGVPAAGALASAAGHGFRPVRGARAARAQS